MKKLFLFTLLAICTTAYSQDVSSLKLYLPFDGSVVDQSTYRHTIMGKGVSFTSDRNGKDDWAVRFDGERSELSLIDRDIVAASDMTVMGWFNFEGTLPSQQTSQIITKYRWDENQRNFRVACEDGLLKVAVWYGQYLPDHIELAVPIQRFRWNHFAFSISAENILRFYLNGCEVASKPLPGPMVLSRQPIRIGNTEYYGPLLPGDNHHFNGSLDELRIYGKEVPAGEIERLAEQQPKRELPDPSLALTFNGSLVDSSSSNYVFTGQDITYGLGRDDTITGGAGVFNGTTTELLLPAGELIKSNDFTVAGWFNFAGVLPSQQTGTIMAKYTWDDGQRNFRLECLDETITLYVWNGFTLDDSVSLSAPLTLNEWHHFTFSISPSNLLSFYLDGCLVGASPLPGGMTIGQQPLRIGNTSKFSTTLPGDNHHFQGRIDEIQIYDTALTPCQLPSLNPTPFTTPTSIIEDTTSTAVTTLADLDINVYPNPTAGQLIIESVDGDYTSTLFDINGTRLPVRRSASGLELGHLPRGAYLLRITSSRGSAFARILKQ